MHYLKTPLNDDLYNQILESSSSPDLITSLFETKEEESIENNYLIRTLSQAEYSKYIVHGTCNGAIIMNNGAVWHNNIDTNFTYYYLWYYSNQDNTAGGYNKIKNLYGLQKNFNEVTMTKLYDSHQTFDTTIKIQLLQDNEASSMFLDSPKLLELGISYGIYASNGKSLTINKINKNTNLYVYTLKLPHWSNYTVTVNFKFNSCFRPVFQYTDNNKATNIYY